MTTKRLTDAEQLRADLSLMTLAAGGDRHAQTTLLTRVMPRVRVVAHAMVGDRSEAEDAVQLALMAILRGAGSFRGESRLETWADRVAARVALAQAHKARVRATRTGDEDVEAVASAENPHLDQSLPRSLREYLDELPEARRSALVLHHVIGYTVEEIAALTSTSPNTVKDRLTQAREHLKKVVRREAAIGRPKRGGQDG